MSESMYTGAADTGATGIATAGSAEEQPAAVSGKPPLTTAMYACCCCSVKFYMCRICM